MGKGSRSCLGDAEPCISPTVTVRSVFGQQSSAVLAADAAQRLPDRLGQLRLLASKSPFAALCLPSPGAASIVLSWRYISARGMAISVRFLLGQALQVQGEIRVFATQQFR